ncbi:MAG TPA: GIY-YIG nuclease family protein, partial [Patescibacteria group bacterium]|nr:GIY-YIG nuclease family protein [Patescibacteria group bacterium]
MYYCYLFRCRDNSLYCGCTKNLVRRQAEHNSGRGAAYTRSRGGGKIVYWEICRSLNAALRREYTIKQWPKAKKE